jgi:hypothetical protein
LVATNIGLDAFVTAALDDAAVEAALAIDGITEIVVYSGAVGHVVERVSVATSLS